MPYTCVYQEYKTIDLMHYFCVFNILTNLAVYKKQLEFHLEFHFTEFTMKKKNKKNIKQILDI